MVGYCLKDRSFAHFMCVILGLSERDCAIFRAMYGAKSDSYMGDRDHLYKKTFFNTIYCFYSNFLAPLNLNMVQVIRFAIVSGRFYPGQSWMDARGVVSAIRAQILWNWVRDVPVTVYAVALFFLDTPSVIEADGTLANYTMEENVPSEWDTADFDHAVEQARLLRGEGSDDPHQRDFLAYSDVKITVPTVAMRRGASYFPAARLTNNADINADVAAVGALDAEFRITVNLNLPANNHTPPLQ